MIFNFFLTIKILKMSKFSSRGIRLKYTNKLCLNDRQGLYVKNKEGASELNHKSIKDWIDFDSKMIYNHVYKSVSYKLQRLELSKLSKNKTMSLEIFDELLLPTLKKGASDIVIMSEKPILSRINGG